MFNIYQFEKQSKPDPELQQKWARDKAQSRNSRRQTAKSACATTRDRETMVNNYKGRVAEFIRDVSAQIAIIFTLLLMLLDDFETHQ